MNDDLDKFINDNFSKLEKKMEAKKNKTISYRCWDDIGAGNRQWRASRSS